MSEKSQNQRSDEEPEESGQAEASGEIDETTAAGVVAPRTGRQEDADTVVGPGPAGHAPMDAMNFRTPEEAAGDATRFPARDALGEPSGLDDSADADEPVENGHATGAGGSATPEPAAALTADRLLAPRDRAPAAGWRRWLYQATLGRVNVGDSDAVRLRRLRENAIKAQLSGGTKYVTVLSRKGGVGKTTATTLLGMALAEVREDRIAALDANPDRGTLSDRSPGQAIFTARQLVQNRYLVDSFAKISQYAARQGSRLHVLASDTDPHVAEAFDDSDYRAVTELMGKFYSIVLTDSGTGMVHSVMQGSLEKSDMVVLVSGASVDEARLASETLSWLEAHGRQDLARNAIVVINQSAGLARGVDVDEIEAHFASRVDSVVRLPYDPHLAEGSEVSLERLRPTTREAVMELAALVVDELRDAR
ncbi:MinD/ParA family ATP-binding protein [Zhihengliuella halotolerans]|uniref:MinD-like ATPase involved in chromosome partitioning or flagellar assembly n=1 Tax=Zhihengliuella halotolerans TaxID=370736 RepID=A0A4V2G9V3_9MICC|nr:MinD/ParA family protein [Zhihengliuella halotolerans]RZU61786.1 MinD-like ATPase involved in chromosome partitioning or flagellar assembly [Zhihengliuella halotolerans]